MVSTALGLWLMAAPAVLGYGLPASTVDRLVGPLVASTAWIAVSEVTRGMRWLNVPLGACLIWAPLGFGYPAPALANGLVVGAALVVLAFGSGTTTKRFGDGWAALLPWPKQVQESLRLGGD